MNAKDSETVNRILRLQELILQLQQFEYCDPRSKPNEKSTFIEAYRQLLINLKYNSKGLVSREIELLLAKIKPEEFKLIYDVLRAKGSVDAVLPLITKQLEDRHFNIACGIVELEPVDAQEQHYEIVKKLEKNFEECIPHFKSIPAYVAKTTEALEKPLTAADDARRQMPLNRREHEIRDAIIQYGSQKQAAIALKLSEASVSRACKEIRRKMKAAGFSDAIIFRPSKGFKKVGNDFVTTEKEDCMNEDTEDDQF